MLSSGSLFMQTPNKKCHRCGLQYPVKDEKCSHCSGFKTDNELNAFKQQISNGKNVRGSLGIKFIIIVFIISGLLYITS
jgi:ribosomal protein L37E